MLASAADKSRDAKAVQAAPADVGSIDAIIAALYGAISFTPGTLPGWERLRSLFHPRGWLVPPCGDEAPQLLVLDVETFIERSTTFITSTGIGEKGFHEREIARRLESFGNIAHAFSTYESRYAEDDPEPFSRGINSIQLVNDSGRWWVLSILWDVERLEHPIPADYLR
jgi:hypothetical protein